MTEETQLHATTTSLVIVPPAELDAGSDIALKVSVSCTMGCDLAGLLVHIIDQQGALVTEIPLLSSEEASLDETASVDPSLENFSADETLAAAVVNDTAEFAVQAPLKPGEYTWTALFPAQEGEGVRHEESSAPFSFVVKPHKTSMNVWDVPTPVVLGAKFEIKVGVLCAAGCKLTGQQVKIYDEQGTLVGVGSLSEDPWSYTGPLYWADVELQAPAAKGVYEWGVRFSEPGPESASQDALEHEACAYSFAFTTAGAPDHVVKLAVVDKETRTPVADADVALFPKDGFPYRTRTDATGTATWNVPKGQYELSVVLLDYKDYRGTAEVDSDVTLEAELVYEPDPGV